MRPPPENANARVAAGGRRQQNGSGDQQSSTTARFIKLPAAMERLHALHLTGLRVLVALASCAGNKTGIANPQLQTLVKRSGLSERNVWRGLKEVRASGLVEVLAAGVPGSPTAYRLRYDSSHADAQDSDHGVSDGPVSDDGDGESLAGVPGNHRPGRQGHQSLDFSTRPETLDSERTPAAAPSLATVASEPRGRKAAPAEPLPDLPPELAGSPEFREAWREWQEHRRQKRQPLTATAAKHQLRNFQEWGVARALSALRHSLANGYQGVFEPNGHDRQPSIRRTAGRSPEAPIPGAFNPLDEGEDTTT